jgi:hypothetical protein
VSTASDRSRLQRPAALVGLAGLALCAVGLLLDPRQFFRSYLVAYLFGLGITLGGLGIVLLHHLTGGRWGQVLRPLLQAQAQTLPLGALLFVPLVFGLGDLYSWADPDVVAHDEHLRHKSQYLNVPFFLARAAGYFAAWAGLAYLEGTWSRQLEQTGDPRLARRLQYFSSAGLAVLGLTVTFAAVDWVMALEPEWYSSIFGVLVATGQVLAGFAFAVAVLLLPAEVRSQGGAIEPDVLNDLGNLLLAFVMLWAYMSFSQFLIIWSGNLPEEVVWYLKRSQGGWAWVAGALAVFSFALPFLLLLSRAVKRDARRLAAVAGSVVAMSFVAYFWMIAPVFSPDRFRVHWLDLATLLALGGSWFAVFLWLWRGRPARPPRQPAHPEALEHA